MNYVTLAICILNTDCFTLYLVQSNIKTNIETEFPVITIISVERDTIMHEILTYNVLTLRLGLVLLIQF